LPFVVLGMNAIFIFVLDGTIRYLLLSKGTSRPDGSWVSLKGAAYARFFEPMGSAEMTSFLFALAWTILITLIAYGMYRKRWFVKI
jgi:predicted acyltransferase